MGPWVSCHFTQNVGAVAKHISCVLSSYYRTSSHLNFSKIIFNHIKFSYYPFDRIEKHYGHVPHLRTHPPNSSFDLSMEFIVSVK